MILMEKVDQSIHIKISSLEQLNEVIGRLFAQLGELEIDQEKQQDIRLCLMEAVENALCHGCADCDQKEVSVSWMVTKKGFCFAVEDPGEGVPEAMRDPEWEPGLFEEHGRGILLMRTILDEVCFNEKGNRVTGRLNW